MLQSFRRRLRQLQTTLRWALDGCFVPTNECLHNGESPYCQICAGLILRPH